MQRLEVSGAVRPIYGSLGVKRLMVVDILLINGTNMAAERESVNYGRNIRCVEQCISKFYMLITCSYVERYLYIFFRCFAKLRKATISFGVPVLPSVYKEQLGSHWTRFYEIWHLSVF